MAIFKECDDDPRMLCRDVFPELIMMKTGDRFKTEITIEDNIITDCKIIDLPKLHSKRCETCKREHTDHHCRYTNVRLSESNKEFLEVVGCASHSDFYPYNPQAEPALTEIEIALRKEENPSEHIQWAIERINRLQEQLEFRRR